MTALYVLAGEYQRAALYLEELDLPPDAITDTLESLAGDLETKATNVAFMARNIEALAAQIKDAEKQMAERRKALESRAERLRDYMLSCMLVAGVKKIEGPMLKISVRDNPGAVEIFDSSQIPDEFMRQPEPPPPVPDKKAIAEAIKAGAEVAGARMTKGHRLEIRA